MEKRTHAGYKACLEDEAYSSGDELGIVGDGLLFKVEGRTSSGRMTPPVGTKRKAEDEAAAGGRCKRGRLGGKKEEAARGAGGQEAAK